MDNQQIIEIAKQVLLNKYVIITAIIVIFYIKFCVFVANYVKKPKHKKFKKRKSDDLQAKNNENSDNSQKEE